MIKVGNLEEVKKRSYWWLGIHVCYTGYKSKPFKVDEDNYQIKCICNSGGLSVNRFKTIYINFNLKELGISEDTFLSHFVMPGYITEFYIYYDRAKKYQNLVYATYYRENNNVAEGYEKVNVGLYQYEPNKYYEILASSIDYENWVYDYYISEAEEYDPYSDYYILQSVDGYEPITLNRSNQYARQYYKLINNNYSIDLYTEKSLTYDGEYINNMKENDGVQIRIIKMPFKLI